MSPPTLPATEIYRRLPHSGAMRLLSDAQFWDDTRIVCRASSHADSDNPLREDGELAGVHALEYAAQAIACHGSLLAGDVAMPMQRVYVAAFRDVELNTATLDGLMGVSLTIRATQIAASGGGWMYDFSVHSDESLIMSGRAVVVVPRASP